MKTRTISEQLEDKLFDIKSSIKDALWDIERLKSLIDNLDDEVYEVSSKSVKEAAKFGLQTMIEKYGYSSNEVRNVSEYIESK